MSWRIVYIENSHKVSLYLDNIKIEDADESYVVPISDINTIIFNNYKLYITTQLLCKLSQGKVCVIICEKNGLPELVLAPLSGSYVSFRNQELQLNMPADLKGNLWKKLIEHKINNQIRVLENNNRDRGVVDKLCGFQSGVKVADVTNREGLAAKMYFRELFGKDFIREKNATDAINAALNYGYTIMRAMLARSVAAKGFIPTVGIFHRNPYNHFNLVDDFIEVYRPIIDEWVFNNMQETFFTREKRLELIDLMSKRIMLDGKKYQIMQSMNVYLDSIINFIKSEEEVHLKLPEVTVFEDDK